MTPSTLSMSWQHPETRRWFVVGELSCSHTGPDVRPRYRFAYTADAVEAQQHGFAPLVAFPSLEEAYESDSLFPAFENRVPSPSQRGYEPLLEWLGLDPAQAEPFALLARTLGTRQTDALELFHPLELSENGAGETLLFLRGVRHQDACVQERILQLEHGEQLGLALHPQNPADSEAIQASDLPQASFGLGWLPRHLTLTVRRLLLERPHDVTLHVDAINPAPAPAQFRLRGRLTVAPRQA